ncbi:transporter substrate-binding domain-containing protein, partial [Halieaceae bacterium]|nr:transporter substrate-binding domain-containing protein [Halieaceae bacterium]
MNKRQQLGEITIRMTVVLVFIFATTLTASVAIALQYHFGRMLASEAASDLYTTASESVASNWQHLTSQTDSVVTLVSQNEQLPGSSLEGKELEMMAGVMRRNPLFYGVYLGHPDGTFFELVNLDAAKGARARLLAVPSDKWLLIDIQGEGSERKRTFRYLDSDFNLRVQRSEATDFDPRERPWYREALASQQGYRSAPYLFAQLGQPGRTISARVVGSDTVVGFDMMLESISDFLRDQGVASESELFVYKADGEIVASSAEVADTLAGIPPLNLTLTDSEREYIDSLGKLRVSNELDWPPVDYAIKGEPRGYAVDVIRLMARALGLDIEFINGKSWAALTEEFQQGGLDILQPVILTSNNEQWGIASRAFMELPFALATRAGSSGLDQLSKLSGKKLAIPAGWSINPVVREAFPDIQIVEPETTLGALQMVLAGDADAALDNAAILHYVAEHYYLDGLEYHGSLDFGDARVPNTLHMILRHDRQPLADILNRAIASITPEQREALSSRWLRRSDTDDNAVATTVPDQLFVKVAGQKNQQGKLLELDHRGEPYFAFVAPLSKGETSLLYLGLFVPEKTVVGPFMDKVLLSISITTGFLLLMMPLSWAFANPIVKPIRQLAIENDKVRRREYDAVVHVDSRVREIHELSDSMVTMVAAIKAHEIAQRELMDAFIKLIAAAIDEKSPYTGGHCERVPELALMLAKHASNSKTGPFAQFQLDTDEQWREYRIAAWLHDCGKITTPEHIVDKGSKLETIYNRVHEIRMRFEVLWRDAEIHYLKSLRDRPG